MGKLCEKLCWVIVEGGPRNARMARSTTRLAQVVVPGSRGGRSLRA